jgi:hypothetical protein
MTTFSLPLSAGLARFPSRLALEPAAYCGKKEKKTEGQK